MNPPLRAEHDRDALIEGIIDGSVDMIATDHAPHTAEDKAKGLEGSAFGIVGLETSFPIMYTYLVKKGVISLERLVELMSVKPAERFGIKVGESDLAVFELSNEYAIDANEFLSKGRSTPFDGYKVFGRCVKTILNGEEIWTDVTIAK